MESTHTLVHTRRSPRREGWVDPPGAGALLLGRYRLLERLGAGGFGVVWRAHDELLDREVAVKRIPLAPDGDGDGDGDRASREALATARLAHPAIVALYEASAAENAFYLISELVHGQTLASLISAQALADEQVLEIGIALTAALSHAHSRGVIHRDVKPQNVLIPHRLGESSSQAGVAKLTDFGGARLAGEDVLTRTGDVLGTFAYMAPEQSDGGEVGEAADLYSLALVLYEALSGVNPVRGATPAATVRRIGRRLEPLERRRGDLPRPLTRALDRALAPSSADRGTLDELRLALEDALVERDPATRRRGRRRGRMENEPGLVAPADRASPPWEADPQGQPAAAHRSEPVRDRSSGERHAAVQDTAEEPARALALPRAVWIACAAAAVVWQVGSGRPGAGLLLFAALAPLVALPRRAGPALLAGALAPALGLVRLAGAFPAIAGQASGWRTRAALGALGYWWLTLAEPLISRRLWLGAPPGTPARVVWEGSISSAATHVVGPMLSPGVLLGATLWAAGAVLLPWLVRGRSAALDVVAATMWSAAIVTAAPLLDGGSAAHAANVSPRGAILGAIFGGVLAVAARALRGPV
ncbi:MAG: serine/threonine-protein kinase [Solirubrobacterales bacterium]